jgi:hypothetical protein
VDKNVPRGNWGVARVRKITRVHPDLRVRSASTEFRANRDKTDNEDRPATSVHPRATLVRRHLRRHSDEGTKVNRVKSERRAYQERRRELPEIREIRVIKDNQAIRVNRETLDQPDRRVNPVPKAIPVRTMRADRRVPPEHPVKKDSQELRAMLEAKANPVVRVGSAPPVSRVPMDNRVTPEPEDSPAHLVNPDNPAPMLSISPRASKGASHRPVGFLEATACRIRWLHPLQLQLRFQHPHQHQPSSQPRLRLRTQLRLPSESTLVTPASDTKRPPRPLADLDSPITTFQSIHSRLVC